LLNAQHPGYRKHLFKVLRLDLEHRVKSGAGAFRVAHLFNEFGEQLEAQTWCELIGWEYQQRWQRGERPTRPEYISRFPTNFGPALRNLKPLWDCPNQQCPNRIGIPLEDENADTVTCPTCKQTVRLQELFYPPGRTIELSEYTVLDFYAAGGMGELYRVQDTEFGRELVVKTLKEQFRLRQDWRERLDREALITGKLKHPCIVPVHRRGRLTDGRPYFRRTLVGGKTLKELLEDNNALNELLKRDLKDSERFTFFVRVLLRICEGVAYAHTERVIHRDLKPANVKVDEFDQVQIMDWGLGKDFTRDDQDPFETAADQKGRGESGETEGALGTPHYMPPEQAKGLVDRVNERADVFSLGAILCEILTGQPPYVGRQVHEQSARGDLADAKRRLAECGKPGALVNLAEQSLDPEPEKRPANASAVRDKLREYFDEVQRELEQALKDEAAAKAETREAKKRKRVMAVALGLLLLLTVALAGASLWIMIARGKAEESATREHDLRETATDVVADLQSLSSAPGINLQATQKLLDLGLPLHVKLEGAGSTDRARYLNLSLKGTQGDLMLKAGRFLQAEEIYRTVLARLAELPAQDRRKLQGRVQLALVTALVRAGKLDIASTELSRLLETASEFTPPPGMPIPPEIADLYKNIPGIGLELALALRVEEQMVEANSCVDQLLAAVETWPATDFGVTQQHCELLFARAGARARRGERTMAIEDLKRALSLALPYERNPGDRDALTLLWRCYVRLAANYQGTVDRDQAEPHLKRALELLPRAEVRAWPHEDGMLPTIQYDQAKLTFPVAKAVSAVLRLELAAQDGNFESTSRLAIGYLMVAACEYRDRNDSGGRAWRAKFEELCDQVKKRPRQAERAVLGEFMNSLRKEFEKVEQNRGAWDMKMRWLLLQDFIWTDPELGKTAAERFLSRARVAAHISEKEEHAAYRQVFIGLAQDMLESAYVEGFVDVDRLKCAKELTPLRKEPRYEELLKRIRLDLSILGASAIGFMPSPLGQGPLLAVSALTTKLRSD
jgi:serine/threonine protein kinase